MNRKKLLAIAEKIAEIENQQDENNILESMEEIERLVSKCSVEDLLEIDEIIMTKYLTN